MKQLIYKADFLFIRITSAELDRETENNVWINGRMFRKLTEYNGYYKSYDLAKQAIVDFHQKRMDAASRLLSGATEKFNQANSL
jgi:beta-glucosidase-like glycosyl hydrolase